MTEPTTQQSSTGAHGNHHVDTLAQVYDHTAAVLAEVRDDQLELPTPCSEWNLRELIEHVVGTMHGIAAGVSGEVPGDPDASDGAAEGDLVAAFAAARDASLAAWSADGVFEGTVNFGAGDMPAEVGIGINTLDTLTHAWDVAEAIGRDRSMPTELAERALAAARMTVSDEIRPGRFAPAVAIDAGAPAHDQLAAFLGRSPS